MSGPGRDQPGPLAGNVIGITADRRWEEQAKLFRKRGADVLHGPTMRTIDLRQSPELRAVTESLADAPPDVLVATTGMGVRLWYEAAADWGVGDELVERMQATHVVARGAKAASACRQIGINVDWRAETEAMPEVLEYLSERVSGARVAVQLFDPDDQSFTAALAGRGAEVVEVPVYRWKLPADVEPAARLIDEVIAGRVAAVTFTSQPAVRNLARIADDRGSLDPLREALNGPVLASCVGPVCAEACTEVGFDDVVYPSPPRLVAQVRQVEQKLAAR